MASIFGHAAAAFGILKLHPNRFKTTKVTILGIVSSILPDLDVLAFSYGITEDHILGHRGITHSIIFGIVWGLILIYVFHKSDANKLLLGCYYTLVTCSHGILDAMTNGGEGVAFFYPITEERYFLPLQVIQVSPIGASHFFSEWGIQVLLSEALYIGSFTLICILFNRWFYK